MKCEILT